VKITTIVDNNALDKRLKTEHGLAFLIETGLWKILFDTGQGGALFHNARQLGLDLQEIDMVVLSHGHYDHTGGLEGVLRSDSNPVIYAHPAVYEPKYTPNNDGTGRYIGIQHKREDISSKAVMIDVIAPLEISKELFITGPIPRETDFEDTGGDFYLDDNCTCPDKLVDDMAVYFHSPEGIVVLLGCAHAGIINTLRYVRLLTNDSPVYAVLGGMHLRSAGAMRIENTLSELRKLEVSNIGPSHCTGRPVVSLMRREFDGFLDCSAGFCAEF